MPGEPWQLIAVRQAACPCPNRCPEAEVAAYLEQVLEPGQVLELEPGQELEQELEPGQEPELEPGHLHSHQYRVSTAGECPEGPVPIPAVW